MSLKSKLMLACIGILLLLTALGIFCMQEIQKVDQSYKDLLNNQEKIKSQSNELVKNFEYSALYMRTYLFTRNQDYQTKYQQALESTKGNLESLKSLVSDDQGKEKIADIEQSLVKYNDYIDRGLVVMVEGPEAVVNFTLNNKGVINDIISDASELAQMQDQVMDRQTEINNQLVASIRTAVITTIAGAVIIGLLLTFVLANKITKPLILLDRQVDIMSKGDLTGKNITVSTKDEIGALTFNFNRMKDSLLHLVTGITTSAKSVVKSSEMVAGTSQQLSAGIEVVASTMNQIAVTSDNVAQDAQAVAAAADETAKLAAEGSQGLDKVQNHMHSINNVSGQVAEAINNLNNRTRDISQIVDMITEIAEQTNLLALNATIEAARAGEQGRGFAVVAEEVRKLAESSAKAAQQIYQMINSIRQESEQAVMVMRTSTHEITSSQQVINEVGTYFRDIIGKVQLLANQVQAVAGSAEEISSGVQNVASVSQEQTSSMQQLSALAEELNTMAEELNNMATGFRIS